VNFNIQPPAIFVFFVSFAKVVSLKVVHSLKACQHTEFRGPTLTAAILASISEVRKIPSSYSNAPLKKMIIQIKLVGMPITIYYTKLRLSTYYGSRVVSIKQNVNCKSQPHAMYALFVFRKSGHVKSSPSSTDLSARKIPQSQVGW
jgi:hypothetical protein